MSKIKQDEECIGTWYGVRRHSTPERFKKITEEIYVCPECKTVYRKTQQGEYQLVESKRTEVAKKL